MSKDSRILLPLIIWAFVFPNFVLGQNSTTAWSVAQLDRILGNVQDGARTTRVEDMEILVSNLQAWRNRLAGLPQPNGAFDSSPPTWPGGIVYYSFSNNVSVAKQKVFLDCAAEWSLFANLQFVARTTQANYTLVYEEPTIDGGVSNVGMTGGAQPMYFGTNGWSHYVICHEIGHALGLVHEHQRSDRDSYVIIVTNNLQPGYTGLIKLTNTRNQTAYDFHSVMHYGAFTAPINPAQPTMIPAPAYSTYAPVGSDDPVLSINDRIGMASIYGSGPALSSIVTNTHDSGLGSLRAALYFAYDHPNTIVTFNIATNDPGFTNHVFNIAVTDQLPCLINATTVDGATQPGASSPGIPLIHIDGRLCNLVSTFASGLRIRGTNCVVRGVAIDGFQAHGVLIDSGASSNLVGGYTVAARNILSSNGRSGIAILGTNLANGVMILGGYSKGNVVAGNYIGVNSAGTASLPNLYEGIQISDSAQSNIVGGTIAGAANVISGNAGSGVFLTGTGTQGNAIEGNCIGLNAAGSAALANAYYGVEIAGGSSFNFVGGNGGGNLISGNTSYGITIYGANSTGNYVQGITLG